MSEKQKQPKQAQSTGGPGSIFDATGGVPASQMVSVSSGPYVETLPVGGMPVGEVRKRFADRLDIAKNSTAIVNGHEVGDGVILKAGEALMFVQHAGEKGAAKVVLEGKQALHTSPEGKEFAMPLDKLAGQMGPGVSTGEVILPNGVRCVLSQGPFTLYFWERPPHIARFKWIAPDSPEPYGPEAEYRKVRIAVPYIIIMAVFSRVNKGFPQLLTHWNECFFRNAPLASINDELMFPALLNCSTWPGDPFGMGHSLSWICTQYLKRQKGMSSTDPGVVMAAGMEAVRFCLLETGFNLSSEHHEGNSWYGASKGIDPRIHPVENWEEETKKDPLFVLDVNWKPARHTIKTLAERTFKRLNAPTGAVATTDDVVKIITNHCA